MHVVLFALASKLVVLQQASAVMTEGCNFLEILESMQSRMLNVCGSRLL
jgi:hypothetical protein